ncbi:MAG: hypothetical protein RL173_1558 [Fibrobacterota bacterium]|jgi:hypothetical protein
MRQFSTIFLLATATTVSAVVPHKFSSGKTAVAQDVNENFVAMDTAIQNRATKAELADKADSVWVAKQVGAKADTSKLSVLASQIGVLQSTTNTIGASYYPKSGVVGSAGTIPKFGVGSTLENSSIVEAGNGSVSVGGGTGWLGGLISTTSADKGAAWTIKNPSQTWSFQIRGDGQDGTAVNSWVIEDETAQKARVWGDATSTNVMTPMNVQGSPVWHAGNLNKDDIPSRAQTRLGMGTYNGAAADEESFVGKTTRGVSFGRTHNAPDFIAPTGWANYLSMPETQGGKATFFAQSITELRAWIGFYNGSTSPLWRELIHDGNLKSMAQSVGIVTAEGGSITGNLRISGKLTTNPGATPADYVFEPDYKLAPLSEVEAFTKANKHLPEVPSASEMTKNGVDLAAMNMVLLKKVEELTLHAIALQKDVEAQKALLADQQKAMVEMKAYLELSRKN